MSIIFNEQRRSPFFFARKTLAQFVNVQILLHEYTGCTTFADVKAKLGENFFNMVKLMSSGRKRC